MKLALPLTLALVAAPAVAAAQRAPLQAPWEPVRLEPPPHFFDPPPSPSTSRAGRVGYEILGGFAGALGGGVVSLGMQCALTPTQCPESKSDFEEFLLIASTMNLIAVPLGVTIAGNLSDGDGGYGWAFLGSLAGMTLAVPTSALLAAGGSGTRTGRNVGIATLVTLLPLAGSIIAYEISTTRREPPRIREARVIPSVDVRPDGASAGATVVF